MYGVELEALEGETSAVEYENSMTVPVTLGSSDCEPLYGSKEAAGADLKSNIDCDIIIPPGARSIIPTGVVAQIPKGYEGQVRSRSGLAAKNGIAVLNSPGTIDSDYRGEIKVILINHGHEDFIIKRGDRIAQLVITKIERVHFIPEVVLVPTERGDGGLGSTGV